MAALWLKPERMTNLQVTIKNHPVRVVSSSALTHSGSHASVILAWEPECNRIGVAPDFKN
jgi:hypothetical protein